MELRSSVAMDKRASLRFDVIFPVVISSEEFGPVRCIARNLSSGGMFVEALEPIPIGLNVKVHFVMERSQGEITAQGRIINHYYLAFHHDGEIRSLVGMGIKFLEFEPESAETLDNCLSRCKTIH